MRKKRQSQRKIRKTQDAQLAGCRLSLDCGCAGGWRGSRTTAPPILPVSSRKSFHYYVTFILFYFEVRCVRYRSAREISNARAFAWLQ